MDSCFSGTLLQSQRAIVPDHQTTTIKHLQDLVKKRAHVVITAGAKDETVAEVGGGGLFTQVLLAALSQKENQEGEKDGYLTAMELAVQVQKKIPFLALKYEIRNPQTPMYGHLEGKGDMILTVYKAFGLGDKVEKRDSELQGNEAERFKIIQADFERKRRADEERLARLREEQELKIREEVARIKRLQEEQERRAAEDRKGLAREKEEARIEKERLAAERRRAEQDALKKRKSEESEGTRFVAPSM
jgi:hypothetical protein